MGMAQEKLEVCCHFWYTSRVINDYEFDTIQSIAREESGAQGK